MPPLAQPFVQLVALLETTGALTHFNNFRLNFSHEGCGPGAVVECNEVANVNDVCPRDGQDNQLCQDQDLSA